MIDDDPTTKDDLMAPIARPPPPPASEDYADRRAAEAVDTAREYTDHAIRALKGDFRKELADLEGRVKVDTNAILSAVRERPQIPGWLAGLTPGRAAAIVGVLGGATSSLVALVAALVPLIAAMRGVYLPVAPVAAPTVHAVPADPEPAEAP